MLAGWKGPSNALLPKLGSINTLGACLPNGLCAVAATAAWAVCGKAAAALRESDAAATRLIPSATRSETVLAAQVSDDLCEGSRFLGGRGGGLGLWLGRGGGWLGGLSGQRQVKGQSEYLATSNSAASCCNLSDP